MNTKNPTSIWNLPNSLTILRVAMIPALIVACYIPWEYAHVLATVIFVLAAITDWLDGYLARKLGLTSNFGAFLDPVADKLIVATALILLVQAHPTVLNTLATIVIISREITISALREWLASLQLRNVVAVSWIGKVKTTMQMIAIALMLYEAPLLGLPISTMQLGQWCLFIAAILTLWSMFIYLRAAWPILKEST